MLNTKSEEAERELIYSLNDEEVLSHAIEALGKMKSAKAKEKISELVNHPKSLIRKQAQKALKAMG